MLKLACTQKSCVRFLLIAFVINYHKLSGFKTKHIFLFPNSFGSQRAKVKVLAGLFSSWRLQGGVYFLAFLTFRGACIPWQWSPPPASKPFCLIWLILCCRLSDSLLSFLLPCTKCLWLPWAHLENSGIWLVSRSQLTYNFGLMCKLNPPSGTSSCIHRF